MSGLSYPALACHSVPDQPQSLNFLILKSASVCEADIVIRSFIIQMFNVQMFEDMHLKADIVICSFIIQMFQDMLHRN